MNLKSGGGSFTKSVCLSIQCLRISLWYTAWHYNQMLCSSIIQLSCCISYVHSIWLDNFFLSSSKTHTPCHKTPGRQLPLRNSILYDHSGKSISFTKRFDKDTLGFSWLKTLKVTQIWVYLSSKFGELWGLKRSQYMENLKNLHFLDLGTPTYH